MLELDDHRCVGVDGCKLNIGRVLHRKRSVKINRSQPRARADTHQCFKTMRPRQYPLDLTHQLPCTSVSSGIILSLLLYFMKTHKTNFGAVRIGLKMRVSKERATRKVRQRPDGCHVCVPIGRNKKIYANALLHTHGCLRLVHFALRYKQRLFLQTKTIR